MSPFVYNVALGGGVALVGYGVRLTYGSGPALIVTGGLVLVLTLLGAMFGRAR